MRNVISLAVTMGALLILALGLTGCKTEGGIDTRAASRIVAPR